MPKPKKETPVSEMNLPPHEFAEIPPLEDWPEYGELAGEPVELHQIEHRLDRNRLSQVVVDFGEKIGRIRPWRMESFGTEIRETDDPDEISIRL